MPSVSHSGRRRRAARVRVRAHHARSRTAKRRVARAPDPVAAMAMVPIIAKEGLEGLRGEVECGGHIRQVRWRCVAESSGVLYAMRLALALLLILQLDPVIGAALCFEREGAASAECAMPERPTHPGSVVAPAGARVPGGCTVAQLCAQPAPVVPQLGHVYFQLVSVVHRAPARWDSLDAPPGVLTPPFHPPRV